VSTAQLWAQVTTATVAALGFLLSLFNLYLRWRDNRSRLRIEKSEGFRTLMPDTPLMILSIANAGKVPLTVSSVFLELRGKQRMVLPYLQSGYEGKEIPCRLEPGEPALYYHDISEIARTLLEAGYSGTAKLKVVAEDGLGKKHKIRTKIMDLEGWATGA